ncbi:MAG: DUF3619 family protein [Betaproteobacteria bacterium]|nr:DUF3619 family protein [Betaproteobacteria bacterium]
MNNHLHDEQELAYKLRLALNHGADKLDRNTIAKLRTARLHALAHQKAAVAGLSLAWAGQSAALFASEVLLPRARTLAALLVLAAGVTGTYYWNNFQQAAENEVIDSALLADDLPINAYLDRGFRVWLEHPSQSQLP